MKTYRIDRPAMGLAAAFVAISASAAGASADLIEWSYGGAVIEAVSNEGNSWVTMDYQPEVTGTVTDAGLKIFGTGNEFSVFSFVGENFITGTSTDPEYRGVQLRLFGTGTFDAANWQHPGNAIRTVFGMGLAFDAGAVDFYRVETSFTLKDAQGNGIIGVGSGVGTDQGPGLGKFEPGGYGFGLAFEDRFGGDYSSAVTIEWEVRLGFDWTGQQSTDSFSFFIPDQSIDLTVIPAPATLGLAAVGLIAAGRRRR